jgi:hypothetical protein
MGQFDALVDRLFPSPADRLFAMSFVERFAGSPLADQIIPAMLQEAAQVNPRILAGELTAEQGRELLMSTAREGFGFAPHVVADAQAWLNDMVAQSGDEATEPQADVTGPRAELIRKLFPPDDRAAAEALAKALDADPRSASRTEALLHEVARAPADMSPQASYDYIRSFAENLGIPSHLVLSALDAISGPAERAHEEAVMRELVGDLTPQARHAQQVAERGAALKDVAKYEQMMREAPGEYWRPENQAAYREALERSIVEAPAAPADGGPAAVPAAAPPAATPPLAQPARSSG